MDEQIEFANPPVVEVVCGAAFTALKALRAPHLGVYWNLFRSEFPRIEEAPLLTPPPAAEIEIELSAVPPLPRVWFLTDDENALIQLQRDRFMYNWRRQQTGTSYPRFSGIFPEFVRRITQFKEFLLSNDLGELNFRQFELTYVNHIASPSLHSMMDRVSDALIDHRRNQATDRFLPEASNFNWVTEYPLPDDIGRLNIAAQTARSMIDDQLVLRLDISAKGIGPDIAMTGMKEWFDVAHAWIVRGFIDVTDERIQEQIWGRQPWAR